jgi:hypothetical protein
MLTKKKSVNGVKNIIFEKKLWKIVLKNFKDHDLTPEMSEMLHVLNLMY